MVHLRDFRSLGLLYWTCSIFCIVVSLTHGGETAVIGLPLSEQRVGVENSSWRVSDSDLMLMSEYLLSLDIENNAMRYVTVNHKYLSNNLTIGSAAGPLLVVDPQAFNLPIIARMIRLHDIYNPPVTIGERRTPETSLLESDFLNAVYNTKIMQEVQKFLDDRNFKVGIVQLFDMWFEFYARSGSGSQNGSSGFEHVLMGETRNADVLGLHNWVYFAIQETLGHMVYDRTLNYIQLGQKGALIETSFTWRGNYKSRDSMFIGTSPEFELAMYTLCWHARPNARCPMQLEGRTFHMQTYNHAQNGKLHVGSAYPMLS